MGKKKRNRSNSSKSGLTPPEKIVNKNENMAATTTIPSLPNMDLSQVITQANQSIYGTNSPQRSYIEPSIMQIPQNTSQIGFRSPLPPPPMYPTQPQSSTPVQQPIVSNIQGNPCMSNTEPIVTSNTDMALQVIIQNMNIMNNRLENVNTTNNMIQNKLQKLDMLEEINTKLQTVEANINSMKKEINDIKTLQDQHSRTLANEERHHYVIEDRMKYLEEQNRVLENQNRELHEQYLKLQTHSMKYNLIFTGLPENTGETREETENLVKEFINQELKIEGANTIEFQNVHRLKPRRDGKHRSIIARFTKYDDHQKVLGEANEKLKNSPRYSVFQQYPVEISERRKALIPKLKEFQRLKRNAKIVYDTLIVDGQPYVPKPRETPHIPGMN